jgi:uncharacterized repeat protein (TIGR03803 family)
MKKKLLFLFACILFTGTLHAQQQMWAVTTYGGATNGGTIFKMNPDGSGFTVDFEYTCTLTSGCHPMGNLMQASDGYLYGTCFDGGQYYSCTIDRYDPLTHTYIDVYDFDISNGDYPRSGLIEAYNGKLYGVASSGCTGGVLYSLDLATLTYTPEHCFDAPTGYFPWGAPIITNNIIYGLTTYGGTGDGVLYNFDIASGAYNVLYNFSTGSAPRGSLIRASNGLLYGMTYGGGTNNIGTIFSFDPLTNLHTILHSFTAMDGSQPEGTLMQAADGKLYGVTGVGGNNTEGVIFSFDIASGTYTKLYDLTTATGSNPSASLYQSANGLLYGTTRNGGSSNNGVLFSFDISSNTYTAFLHFSGANGANPDGGFVMVEFPTGLSNAQAELFSIHPNPVEAEINLTLSDNVKKVQLVNAIGEIIFESNNFTTRKIDVSGLHKGIYFVKVTDEKNNSVTKKVVKM